MEKPKPTMNIKTLTVSFLCCTLAGCLIYSKPRDESRTIRPFSEVDIENRGLVIIQSVFREDASSLFNSEPTYSVSYLYVRQRDSAEEYFSMGGELEIRENIYFNLDPGVYEISGIGNITCEFLPEEPALEFEVRAGEILYVGSLLNMGYKEGAREDYPEVDIRGFGCGAAESLYANRAPFGYAIYRNPDSITRFHQDFPNLMNHEVIVRLAD